MAGKYPDVPSRRMAYDRDGTIGVRVNESIGTIISILTPTELRALNDDSVSTTYRPQDDDGTFSLVLMFPEPRDLTHYHLGASGVGGGGSTRPILVSEDTTNGFDGTWTQVSPAAVLSPITVPAMRENHTSLPLEGVIAIKFWSAGSGSGGTNLTINSLHLYGSISDNGSLRVWEPVTDKEVEAAYFDWGDIRRSSATQTAFRIKNTSGGNRAEGVTVSVEALTDTTPSVPGQQLLSADGENFTATLDLGDLEPGQISLPIFLRRVTPLNAFLGLWTARLIAVADNWVGVE